MSNYLQPVDDGLEPRPSQDYVRYKLGALAYYLTVTNTAMRDKPWSERFYIDLLAGPGKNRIGSEFVLGSPLIALTAPYPATQFRFNELKTETHHALQTRIEASELRDRVRLFQEDSNKIVAEICAEIAEIDRVARKQSKWSTLNIAFLDPEGLIDLEWTTVEQLARMQRMDLIINFSTGGVRRTIGRGNNEAVDKFFGSTEWRSIVQTKTGEGIPRKPLIDFYLSRLKQFGYYVDVDPELGGEYISVNNSRNVEVYSLIFASKHELGEKFWKQAAKSVRPPKLPGFE